MRPHAVAAATFALLFAAQMFAGQVSAAQVAADEMAIGPWRLGMSKDQVTGFARYQPYATVAAKHGLETLNGTFLGETRKLTFMFDDGGLSYIKVTEYEGDNFEDAGNAILRIFDFFEKNLGGASVDGVDLKEDNATTKLDRSVLKLLIVQTLGTAEDQNEKTKQEKGATMTMVFDMRPAQQPDGSVFHCQWGFTGSSKTYFVHVFQDRTTNPKRAAVSIVSLQKQ